MTAGPGRYSALAITAAALIILAVLGSRGGEFGGSELWPPERLINQIAVVTTDRQVLTYHPDGSGSAAVSSGTGYFTWPTWSPDGQEIVYSGVVENSDGEPVTTLFLHNTDSGSSRSIYESPPDFVGLLADGVLHYSLWSPDGGKLAFIAATPEDGLTLYLDYPSTLDAPMFVLDRGPLWMSWSPNSTKLLAHRAETHFIVNAEETPPLTVKTDVESQAYRVPAWASDSEEFNIVKEVSSPVFALYSIPSDDPASARPMTRVAPNAAFLRSRDGSRLAIADQARPVIFGSAVTFVYRQLRILDIQNPDIELQVNENILSYFWSPDSAKIAYVTLVSPQGGLRWMVLDIATEASSPMVDFLPSSDQLTMFQFFDQYAYSHSLWSPDSRYLLFAGALSDTAATAGNAGQFDILNQIFIVDTASLQSVYPITDGVLGVWSPI